MSRLHPITFGTYGDARRRLIFVDVPAFVMRTGLPVTASNLRIIGRAAIRELREAGIGGVIVARLNGLALH